MRSSISLVLLFEFLLLQGCISRDIEGNEQSWINIKYIECLKKSLPCDCEKITQTYFSLSIDTDPQSRTFGIALSKFEQLEPYIYPIKKTGANEYNVLKSQEDTSSWAKLIVKGERLNFIEDGKLSSFTRSKKSNGYNPQHYFDDNVDLLNAALSIRQYPKLEEIINEDSLKCDCNKWMGNINIVYVKGAPRSWIIDMRDDTLVIKRIINVDRDPDDPVQTEEVISYKWN